MTFFSGWTSQMEAGMAAIESMWGEQADLLPWQSKDEVRFVEPGPDSTRPMLLNVRILFKRKLVMEDREGEGSVGSQITYAVIKNEFLDQVQLQQGDRVRLLERGNQLFEVVKYGLSYTTRKRVYLAEKQEPPT